MKKPKQKPTVLTGKATIVGMKGVVLVGKPVTIQIDLSSKRLVFMPNSNEQSHAE